jgi:branched-chain amino acid transport system substrate-binding protein
MNYGIRSIFAMLLAICASVPAFAADPYKLGFISAATGYGAFIGDPEVKAARLYVKLLNQAGGIGGRQVELVVYDSEGSPEKAVVAMKRLITQDKVTAVIGPDFSSTVRAVLPLVEEAKIVAWGMTPVITPPAGSYMFASFPIQEYAYEQEIVWFKKRGLNTLGILASTDTTGQEGVKFLREITRRAVQYPGRRCVSATAQPAAQGRTGHHGGRIGKTLRGCGQGHEAAQHERAVASFDRQRDEHPGRAS